MSSRLRRSRKSSFWQRTLVACRRLSAGFVAFTVVLTQLPVVGAFEAHVINVMAEIAPRCEDVVMAGTKFDDENLNGVRDVGEPGLNGWMIELKRGPYVAAFDYNGNGANDSNDFGVLEAVITDPPGPDCPAGTTCDFNGDGSLALASGDLAAFQNWLALRDLGNQVTDSSGHYQFPHLTFGDYVVTEVQHPDWEPTTNPRRAVSLQGCATTVDFGNRLTTPPDPFCRMELVKTDTPDPVQPGQELHYRLTLTSTGTGMCTGGGVKIQEHYDPRVTFVRSTPTPMWGNNNWSFGEVPPGQVNVVDVTVLVPPDAQAGDVIANEACFWTREYDRWTCVTETTPVTLGVCGNDVVEPGEACDDGNLINSDGCESSCQLTTWCGDGVTQTPNAFGQAEACDDGANNGTGGSRCTTQCTPKVGECSAVSPPYFADHDGCSNGTGASTWASGVNTLSDSFFDVFATIDGAQMCLQFSDLCALGSDVDQARCQAKKHLLAGETDVAAMRLRLDALVAGADDGNAAFDALGVSATSTVQQALAVVEQVVADAGAAASQLNRAHYVARRLTHWYASLNPNVGECVLPGLGNGVVEQPEQCDDGNLKPWDGCAPSGTPEVVLNEILANPVGADDAPQPGGEWVELYNRAAQPIALDEFVLYDVLNSHELFITAGNTNTGMTTIAAGGTLVVYRNGDADFTLNNSGDTVRLYTDEIADGGARLDKFSWSSAKPEGSAYARLPDGVGDWVDPCPTPGGENVADACAAADTPQTPALPVVDEEPPDTLDPWLDAATYTDEVWLTLFPQAAETAPPPPVAPALPSLPVAMLVPTSSPAIAPAEHPVTPVAVVGPEGPLPDVTLVDAIKAEDMVVEPTPVVAGSGDGNVPPEDPPTM